MSEKLPPMMSTEEPVDDEDDDIFSSTIDDLSSLRNEELYSSVSTVPPPLTNINLNEEHAVVDSDVPLNKPKEEQLPKKKLISNGFEEEIDLKENDTSSNADEINKLVDVPHVTIKDKIIENIEQNNNFIKISISESTKVGEGMSSYVAYRIVTRTNMPMFKTNNMAVLRRFSDFLGLHNKLTEKYLRNGRLIPPAPQKNMLGSTRIKISGNQSDQATSAEFIEKRRLALERFLKRIALHPILRNDKHFCEFLEQDCELPKATSTSALSGAGVMRLFNKVGETVNKITYKMDENEPWFEEKEVQIENLDLQLRNLHGAVESLVINRKELAHSSGSFAKSAAVLSNCEEHTGLSRALSQLADVFEKVELVRTEQANTDFSIFCELLKDYIGLIGAVKNVFHERVKVYQNMQHAQMILTKKREQKSKLELTGRLDKVGTVTNEVSEWEAKLSRSQDEFDQISKTIKVEFEQFEINRIKEFKTVISSYLEEMINHQTQIIKHWQAFIPEAKAIA
ncbi:Sorting nexin Vps5-like, C-terminal,Phox homologous domain,Arfaptin homology (AH) domain/BAR [Cinara cedri]|uniref:Sorting nexin Vps5-like, C-terminal,Phox homologous domain,Arfaptin homology (AH) domain/BAR n=1 Tax=Cinara cedri TaxID=506608 RepID=A0A5E4MTR4_9HEMI|nr:Sorting nexin Vps5-like, C-terminal,Phox homologous domain,Arfaptin homology (AH) domain/BAR [Cinara cedri]